MTPDWQAPLLERIGLSSAPAPNAAGLRTLHRAYVAHVPFENLAVQLGESAPLELRPLVDRILTGGRGGYCFEANTVLHALLESLGFSVERRQAIVGPRDLHARGAPTDHLALVAKTADEGEFIAEGGFGEGPTQPLPLAVGHPRSGAFSYAIDREGDGWWVGQHEFGSAPGFRLADEAASLADFQAHHARISTAPESRFVQTLVVQRPFDDHILALRSRTLSTSGPGYDGDPRVLEDSADFATTLDQSFGIDPDHLGSERIARLWERAVDQHAGHQQR